MSLRQCLRCLRMKREVKRGGICDECRRLVPNWRAPQSPVESIQQRRPLPAQSVPPPATVKNAAQRPATAEPAASTHITIICSRARRGESTSDWTLGFEGNVSLEQRRVRISRLLESFARVRVFVAKLVIEEYTAGTARGSLPEARRTAEPFSRTRLPIGGVSQSAAANPPQRAATPRLVKRASVRTDDELPNPAPTSGERRAVRVAGPYLEEPD
jgi:hypothetical protein